MSALAKSQLMSKVKRNPVTGCWLWVGSRDNRGYGYCRVVVDGARMTVAHRAMYVLCSGGIPAGYHLDHLCHVKNCVNPDHLEPVTPAENTRRSIAAGDRRTRLTGYNGNGRTYREFCRRKRAAWLANRAEPEGASE